MVGLDGVPCAQGLELTAPVMLDGHLEVTANAMTDQETTNFTVSPPPPMQVAAAPEPTANAVVPAAEVPDKKEEWSSPGRKDSADECKLEPTKGKWSDEGKDWNCDDWSSEAWDRKG